MTNEAIAETDAAVEAIGHLLANARPVPLTGQVRLDLKEAQALVSELREALERERAGGDAYGGTWSR
jgi:hypothetical protein